MRGSVVFDDVIAGWPGFPEADRPRDQARNRPDRASGFSGRCHLEIPQRDIFPQKPGRFHLLLTPFLVALNLRFIAVPPPALSGKNYYRFTAHNRLAGLNVLLLHIPSI